MTRDNRRYEIQLGTFGSILENSLRGGFSTILRIYKPEFMISNLIGGKFFYKNKYPELQS